MNDQRRPDKGSDQHCGHGDQAAPRKRSLASRERAVGSGAGKGQGEHGGGQVGHCEFARGCVLDPHGDPEDDDQGVAKPFGHRVTSQCGEDHRSRKEYGLDQGGGVEQTTPVFSKARADFAAHEGAGPERRQGHQRCRDRETWRPGEGKAQEHDVARHVGDEDVPEHQIAEGIDQAGEECQAQEQRGQRAVPAVAFRNERLAHVGEEGVHGRTQASA